MTNIKSLFAASGLAAAFGLAILVAFAGRAGAEPVTLSTPDGSIEMTGDLIGFNGADYTILSAVGVVTVSAVSVLCEGIKCPEMDASDIAYSVAGLHPDAELIKISD